jgi:hypothetical protein
MHLHQQLPAFLAFRHAMNESVATSGSLGSKSATGGRAAQLSVMRWSCPPIDSS